MKNLDVRQLVTSITAGLVAGLIVIVFCISLAALIFSGEMSDYVSRGIGLFLFGGFVMSVLLSIFGTFPGTAIGPQDGPAALVAVAASGIVASIAGTPDSVFSTVVATIMLCSFATGVIFFLIGTFKLGDLVRYIPYPVVGGFLAGTGWLLTRGAKAYSTRCLRAKRNRQSSEMETRDSKPILRKLSSPSTLAM